MIGMVVFFHIFALKGCVHLKRQAGICSAALIALIVLPLTAGEYVWPTSASRLLTSSFGEFRSDHFHAGIDIKTWGQSGYPVFAVGDGSVIRLLVSPYGYGKALFLKLNDGRTAVYGHLSGFAGILENHVASAQRAQKRYRVRVDLPENEYAVTAGELLGFSGRTGTVAAHLHFEIHDSLGFFLNPLGAGFSVLDSIAPVIHSLAVTPLASDAFIDGDALPCIYPAVSTGPDLFQLPDTIHIRGRTGLSLFAEDVANGAFNRLHPYCTRVFIDDSLIFSSVYDRMSEDDYPCIYQDRDYRLHQEEEGVFQKLYFDGGNLLPFYFPAHPGAGVLSDAPVSGSSDMTVTDRAGEKGFVCLLDAGNHDLRISVSDFYGNRSQLTGIMRSFSGTGAGQVRHLSFREQFRKSDLFSFQTSGTNQNSWQVNYGVLNGFVYFYVQGKDTSGIPPQLYVIDSGWTREPVGLFPVPGGYAGTHSLRAGGPGSMEIRLIDRGIPVFHGIITLSYISPRNGGVVLSPDGNIRVVFPPEAVFQPYWGMLQEDSSDVQGKACRFFPDDTPLRKPVRVQWRLNTESNMNQQGLCLFQKNGQGRYSFAGNRKDGNILTGELVSLHPFTALHDTIPPELTIRYPGEGDTVRHFRPVIEAVFDDTLSGILDEDNYHFVLNSDSLIVAYDPAKNTGTCRPREQLVPGEQHLIIDIRDMAGNKTVKKIRFFFVSGETGEKQDQ